MTILPDANTITEDSAPNPVAGNVLTNDTTAAGTLSVTTPGTVVLSHGVLAIYPDGTYTYTLDNTNPAVNALNDGQTLTDAFTYGASNGQGGTGSAKLTITIHGHTDLVPTAVDDEYTVAQDSDTMLLGPDVTANDTGFTAPFTSTDRKPRHGGAHPRWARLHLHARPRLPWRRHLHLHLHRHRQRRTNRHRHDPRHPDARDHLAGREHHHRGLRVEPGRGQRAHQRHDRGRHLVSDHARHGRTEPRRPGDLPRRHVHLHAGQHEPGSKRPQRRPDTDRRIHLRGFQRARRHRFSEAHDHDPRPHRPGADCGR